MRGRIQSAGVALPDLRIEHLWPIAVLTSVFMFLNINPVRPHDFWWHLKAGQVIAETGAIPTVDAYSFTRLGAAYLNYASYWFMELALHWLYSLGGIQLVILVHAMIVTAAYALLLWLCFRVSRDWRVAAWSTLFAVVVGLYTWNVRPQSITFLLGSLVLWAIYEYRWTPRPWLLAVFPLAMIVWVNSHGSFVIGFLMLALWLADEIWHMLRSALAGGSQMQGRRLFAPLLALAMSALATLANPRGLGLLAYVSDLSGNPIIRNLVPEWAPPSLDSPGGAFFLLGLLFCAVLLAASPRRPSLFQILTFLAFALLALRTSRGIVWFGIAMAPVLAAHLAALVTALRDSRASRTQGAASAVMLPRPGRTRPGNGSATLGSLRRATGKASHGRKWINYCFLAILCAGVVLALPWFKHVLPLPRTKQGLVSVETPVEATEYLLKEHLPGPLFNAQAFGSYLIWAAQPDYPVFVDTRLELYPLETWLDYLEISGGRGDWSGLLAKYGINTLMLSPDEQAALYKAATASPDWRVVYSDDGAILLVRSGSS